MVEIKAIQVKPLVWVGPEEKPYADSSIGVYQVGKIGIMAGWFSLGQSGWNNAASIDAAKAAAEADYEQRVLSAICAPLPADNGRAE